MLLTEKTKNGNYCFVDSETGEVYDLSRLHDVEAIRKLIFDLEFKLNQISNRDEHIIQLLSGE
ncbi:hypothetical protein [Methanobrevibacter sp.]|jgi:hypothetical protein|uniref:hypothetical protein n=1 Tax=Methanobrevibacter sp. TaxID=66852 RepID=UPI00386CC791